MIESAAVSYIKGNGIVRQVKRAKECVRIEKDKAAKVDLGLGCVSGILTFLACKAIDIEPSIAPIMAVLLTPIFGKLHGRYEKVDEAKREYKNIMATPEYQDVLKRYNYMEKRRMLRPKVKMDYKA